MTTKPPPQQRSLTAHLILDQLSAEGTRYVFGSNSSCHSPITTALLVSPNESESMHFVGTLHESVAVFMATGYTQATSLPSVVNVSAGQGLLSALPGIYAAHRTQAPIVVLADQEDSHLLNDDPPLSVDHHRLASSVCKWMAEARTAREVARLIRRAFHEALTPPKGPVVLSIPINLSLSSARAQVIKPPITSPLGPADENFIGKIVQRVVESKNPCIISGNEVSQYRARKEVVLLADVLGCPTFSEPLPTGVNFPNRHPHFAGVLPRSITEANELLTAFDLYILLGVQNRLPNRSDGPSLVPDEGTVVQINMDGHLAGKSIRSNLATQADIAQTLSTLRTELQLKVDKNWVAESDARARTTIANIAKKRQQKEEGLTFPDPKHPATLFWLLRLLDGIRPQKSVVVSDIASSEDSPFDVLSLESGSSFFSSTSGVAGYAGGASLGIQWASKEIPVICVTSDESFLGYPQALWTAAHYKLNLKFIIAKVSGSSGMVLEPSAPTKKMRVWQFDEPNIYLNELAESMGVKASTVNNFSQLEPELNKLFEDDGPRLLEILVKV